MSVEDWGCGQLIILYAFSSVYGTSIYLINSSFFFLLYINSLCFYFIYSLCFFSSVHETTIYFINFFYQHFWYLVVLCQQSLYLFRGHTCVLHMVSMIDNLKTGYFCSLISDRLFVILSTL